MGCCFEWHLLSLVRSPNGPRSLYPFLIVFGLLLSSALPEPSCNASVSPASRKMYSDDPCAFLSTRCRCFLVYYLCLVGWCLLSWSLGSVTALNTNLNLCVSWSNGLEYISVYKYRKSYSGSSSGSSSGVPTGLAGPARHRPGWSGHRCCYGWCCRCLLFLTLYI